MKAKVLDCYEVTFFVSRCRCNRRRRLYYSKPAVALLAAFLFFASAGPTLAERLPSWSDGVARRAIVKFVSDVSTEGAATFVAPADRIAEQRRVGTLGVWAEPFVPLRLPKLYNLRMDPFERADLISNTYYDWFLSKLYMIGAAGAIVQEFLQTFKAYPPKQKTFTIDQAMEKMKEALSGAHR
jgi:hypothetical protein